MKSKGQKRRDILTNIIVMTIISVMGLLVAFMWIGLGPLQTITNVTEFVVVVFLGIVLWVEVGTRRDKKARM